MGRLTAPLAISTTSYCVKSVQIRSFCWSVFSSGWIWRDTPYLSVFSRICPYSVQMRENTGQKNFRISKLFTLLGSEFSLVNLLLLISNTPPLRLCKKNWNFLHCTTNKIFHYWSFFISHLLKKSLMENFIFCAVLLTYLF